MLSNTVELTITKSVYTSTTAAKFQLFLLYVLGFVLQRYDCCCKGSVEECRITNIINTLNKLNINRIAVCLLF